MSIGTIKPYATRNGTPNKIVGIHDIQCVVENSHCRRYVPPIPIAKMTGEMMKSSIVANPRLRCDIFCWADGQGIEPPDDKLRTPIAGRCGAWPGYGVSCCAIRASRMAR